MARLLQMGGSRFERRQLSVALQPGEEVHHPRSSASAPAHPSSADGLAAPDAAAAAEQGPASSTGRGSGIAAAADAGADAAAGALEADAPVASLFVKGLPPDVSGGAVKTYFRFVLWLLLFLWARAVAAALH